MNPQTANQINGPQTGEVSVSQDKTRFDIVPRYVVDDLQAQLDAAQKVCAEMRRALERIRFVNPMSEKSIADQLNENVAMWYHALSADCGKDYIAKAEVKPLKDALNKLAGYAATVRMDRRKVVDGEIMCLQMEDWCAGLLDYATEAEKALARAKDIGL